MDKRLWELYLTAIPALAHREMADEDIAEEAFILAEVALKHWEQKEALQEVK